MKCFRRVMILMTVLLFTCVCLVGFFYIFVPAPKKDSDIASYLQSDELFFHFGRSFFPAPEVISVSTATSYKHVRTDDDEEWIVFTFMYTPDEYLSIVESLNQDIPRIEAVQADNLTYPTESNENVSDAAFWRCYSGYYESEQVWMAAMYGTNNTSCELTFVFCFDEELNSVDPLDLARNKYAVETFK